MVPVPKYLRNIATKSKEKKENLTMNIRCLCGCNDFIFLKNIPKKAVLTAEQKRLKNLQVDFPVFTSKITLLLENGLEKNLCNLHP